MSSLLSVLDVNLIAAVVHPQHVETATSPVAAGTDVTVGLAMMITGLAIFVSCLLIRKRWFETGAGCWVLGDG